MKILSNVLRRLVLAGDTLTQPIPDLELEQVDRLVRKDIGTSTLLQAFPWKTLGISEYQGNMDCNGTQVAFGVYKGQIDDKDSEVDISETSWIKILIHRDPTKPTRLLGQV